MEVTQTLLNIVHGMWWVVSKWWLLYCCDNGDERKFFFHCFQNVEEREKGEKDEFPISFIQTWMISDDSTFDLWVNW